MAQQNDPFAQPQDPFPQPPEGHNLLGGAANHVAPLQPVAPVAPPPHLPPVYANLIVNILQAAAAQGVNLFGAPLPPLPEPPAPAGNDDDDLAALIQDGQQGRRRAAANGRERDGGNRRNAAGSGSESVNGEERRPAAGAESYSDQMAKAKSVLTQPFVFASLLYSLVISYTLSVRGNDMSLVNGRPVDSVAHVFMSGPDQWNTTTAMPLLMACFAFLVILLTHFYLISHLMMRRPAGAPTIQRWYSCFIPITLTLATELYFVCYMNLSRYGVSTKELIILGVFSAVLICVSLNIIICTPLRQEQVVVTQRVHVV